MSSSSIDVLQHLSANLKAARLAAGLSQEALAQRSEVSRRMLVGLETGQANVSFATLDRLARVLGVTFAELVRPAAADLGEAPVLAWRGVKEGSRAYLLQSHRVGQRAFELWEWRLAAGDRYDAEADAEGFQEMLYVADGSLTLEMGRERIVLAAGRSHLFATNRRYAYVNDGDAPCIFVKNVIAVLAEG